ncbi:recombinase family protein [Arthrobacter cryoconiti]|uniref:Recombinase family protein n=1 Tax=Arthrobacter cryoconiti TaxID=748907 RepID=A0ABV8R2W2_9MICC|nr:recombinase family protein [Arthrobacter cryoconiti]MCC9067881.1 recombinase family protein [Arthrobacter cryoconiti]
MTRLGCARVSTVDQETEMQIRELEATGCERICRDHGISGTKAGMAIAAAHGRKARRQESRLPTSR